MTSTVGKGSVRRPSQISKEQLAKNWARTFGPKPPPQTTAEEPPIVFAVDIGKGRSFVIDTIQCPECQAYRPQHIQTCDCQTKRLTP